MKQVNMTENGGRVKEREGEEEKNINKSLLMS